MIWFAIVYGGADYITATRDFRIRVDFDFEQRLPFVPELILVYSSIYLMFAVVPFVFRAKRELWSFVGMMVSVTCVAGIGFLAMPSEIQFVVPADHGMFPGVFRIADSVNLTYNLCPSLHVGYAAMGAEAFRRRDSRFRLPFHLWALSIAMSAWLTYQHHALDIVVGYSLGVIAVCVWRRAACSGI